MEILDLKNASLKYYKPIEIETALTWSAVKNFLEDNNKYELFKYIKAIKITQKNIQIITNKPLAKSELNLIREPLAEAIESTLSKTYKSINRNIKIV